MTLSPDDRRELLAAIHTITASGSVLDFAQRTAAEVMRLVPGIRSSYNEINVAARRVCAVVHPDPGREWFDTYGPVFHRHFMDNPTIQWFEATGSSGVRTWSDLDPEGTFLHSALHREFYAPLGIYSQIACALPVPPGRHVVLAVNRDGTQFTARERALLEELRLHLVNVYRLVSRAEASQQQDAALADDGWSVVLVDDEGTVVQSNEVAVEIGREADVDLGAGATLAGTVLWSEVSGSSIDLWASAREAATRRVGDDIVAFEARLLRSVAVGPHVLWIRRPSRVTMQTLSAQGFTERQAQVALKIIDGHTNERIARDLTITVSTVRRHIEAIYRRLGVTSRAAAVGRLQAGPAS